MNVGGWNEAADIVYKINGDWLDAPDIATGYAATVKKGNHMFILSVISTQRNPESAKL